MMSADRVRLPVNGDPLIVAQDATGSVDNRAVVRLVTGNWRKPLELGNVAAGVLAVVLMVAAGQGFGADAAAYWNVDPFHPYPLTDYGAGGAFVYSPPIAFLMAPLGLIPFPLFLAGLLALNVGALYYLVGKWIGYALLLPPVMTELMVGNVNLLLTVAIVVGLRKPAAWAFVLLTKVTPGVGLLWFLVRREWRSLGIALGVTGALVAVSLVNPEAWATWIGMLTDNAGRPLPELALPVPFVIRLPLAAGLVVYGARTDRPWLVPVACFLAIPVIWRLHYVMLLGALALWVNAHADHVMMRR